MSDMGSGAPADSPAGRPGLHGPGSPPGRQGRRAAAGVAGWLVAAPLALAAVAHLTGLDQDASVLLLVAGLTPLLWVAAVIGWWARGRVLAALSVGLLVLYLSWALAGLGLPRTATPAAAAAPRLRVFSANLHFGNPDVGSMATELGAAAPDVAAVAELSPDHLAGCGARGCWRPTGTPWCARATGRSESACGRRRRSPRPG
jgi:hypothetical protein